MWSRRILLLLNESITSVGTNCGAKRQNFYVSLTVWVRNYFSRMAIMQHPWRNGFHIELDCFRRAQSKQTPNKNLYWSQQSSVYIYVSVYISLSFNKRMYWSQHLVEFKTSWTHMIIVRSHWEVLLHNFFVWNFSFECIKTEKDYKKAAMYKLMY